MKKQKTTRWQTALVLFFAGIGLAVASGCATDTPTAVGAQGADAPGLPAPDLYAGSPYLGELRNSLVYGEIWERPQLSKRDRSLITVAVLQALVRDELTLHIPRGRPSPKRWWSPFGQWRHKYSAPAYWDRPNPNSLFG